MAHRPDKAEKELVTCKQMGTMSSHVYQYNILLAESRTCGNSGAARRATTSRAERKRFINSCMDTLPAKMTRGDGRLQSPRAHLYRKLHMLKDMEMLQKEAMAYCANVLDPVAFEVGVKHYTQCRRGSHLVREREGLL